MNSRLPDVLMDSLARDGWVVIDGLLPPRLPQALLAAAEHAWAQGDFHEAGIGHGLGTKRNSAIRGDAICWLERNSPCLAGGAFLQWADGMQQRLNEQLFLGLNNAEFHFARYPTGAHYRKHIDQHRDQPNRRISLVLYLNTPWEADDGGELVLYSEEDPSREMHRVIPQAGRLALFRSDTLWHAVAPARKPRWSLTGWFRTDRLVF